MPSPNLGLRVTSVSISGLFGLYDHHISLNQRERVTILHGPNGVGKSALLRLLAAFFGGRFYEFVVVPFSSFRVELSDGQAYTIYRPPESDPSSIRNLLASFGADKEKQERFPLPFVFRPDDVALQIEKTSPFIARVSEQLFMEYRSNARLTSEEVVRRYGTAADLAAAYVVNFESEPSSARTMRSRVAVQLVETQRLLRMPPENYQVRHDRKPMIATVRTYADEIVLQINRTLSLYATESQKLDQTFPQRLINTPVFTMSAEQLKERLRRLDEQQTTLNALGLIDKVSYPASPSQIDALDNVKRSVMALYVEDTERKLQFLADLARRIQLLLISVNGMFRNKRLLISRERGLRVHDLRGRPVPLEALSSGEQHELVLWFDLLFKVETNTLVLIDEPELSLHVTWQKKFLPDLLDIAQAVGFDALLATHSPYIIGDRLDLTVALDAEVDE